MLLVAVEEVTQDGLGAVRIVLQQPPEGGVVGFRVDREGTMGTVRVALCRRLKMTEGWGELYIRVSSPTLFAPHQSTHAPRIMDPDRALTVP